MPYVNHAKARRKNTSSTDNKEKKTLRHLKGAVNHKVRGAAEALAKFEETIIIEVTRPMPTNPPPPPVQFKGVL
jgi:hypothetical protein